MKRHGHLFERVVAFDNLLRAARQARRGKRRRPDVARFELNRELELARLQDELCSGAYRPGPYRAFRIREPRERLISAAPYRDRVVHHAVCNVIEPIFEATFTADSFASRRGYGTHRAVARLQRAMRRHEWLLKLDVRKFFPSMDHAILKERLARKIRDDRLMELLGRIVDASNPQEEAAYYFPGDDLFTPAERRRGLPIGNLTSQFFANVYLNGLDHFVKERLRCPAFVRYVDDGVLLGRDPSLLRRWWSAVAEHLDGLRLVLHPRKCRIARCAGGVAFLGYRVFPHRKRMLRAGVVRFMRRTRRQMRRVRRGVIPPSAVAASVRSWLAHAMQADTRGLRASLLARLEAEWGDEFPFTARMP